MPSPLKSSRLRRILVAYTVNRLGTWFGYVALSLAVFEHTHNALAVAALLVAGQALPALLVPALVARIEASPRRGELSGLYLFEAAVTAALAALLAWRFSLPVILLLVALDGTAALAASALLRTEAARCAREWASLHYEATTSSPESPSAPTSAGLPGINLPAGESAGNDRDGNKIGGKGLDTSAVEAERKTNAAINIAFSGTFVMGPALAGVLVAAAGGPIALLIDAVSFLLCAAMLIDLHPHVEEAGKTSVRARLGAAWEHINDVVGLRTLLLTEGVALVFFAADGSIEVPYATVTLHAGDRGYGLLLGMWGLGVALGSIVFARSIKRSLGVLLSASTLAVGLAYLGWAAAPTLASACAAGLLGGIGNGVQWAAFISTVQGLTPQNLHGRIMGAVESLGAISPAIGLSLGGALVALSSPRDAFLIVGLGAALSTVAFIRLPPGKLTGTPSAPAAIDENLEQVPEQPPSSMVNTP